MAPITLSRGFSVEILIGVWLYHGRLNQIEVFLSWKIEYSDSYITVVKTCCKKGSHHERQACIVNIEKSVSLWRYILQMGGLSI